ncbi:hypothetical protein SCUP515_00220 [Seiridium cupressi]
MGEKLCPIQLTGTPVAGPRGLPGKPTLPSTQRVAEGPTSSIQQYYIYAPSPRWITSPDEFRLPEDVIQLSQLFASGSREKELWNSAQSDGMAFASANTSIWSLTVGRANAFLGKKQLADAFSLLNESFERLSLCVRDPDPSLPVFMYLSILALPAEVGQQVLGYAAKLSFLALPSCHPMRLVWWRMRQVPYAQARRHTWLVLFSYFDAIKKHFSHLSWDMAVSQELLRNQIDQLGLFQFEAIENSQWHMIRRLQEAGYTLMVHLSRLCFAAACHRQGRNVQAHAILNDFDDGDAGGAERSDGSIEDRCLELAMAVYQEARAQPDTRDVVLKYISHNGTMSSHTYEQIIRFTTDSVGLERTLRLLQSIAQILSSYPASLGLFVSLLDISAASPPSYSQTHTVLLALRQRLGLARRFFRVFRFLDSFNSAQKLYANISPQSGTKRPLWVHLESYLDVFGRTFNGMYLLLETSTMVDALQIEGLRVWTPEWERVVTIEAQRFWLFALVCGVLSGLLKALKVLAYTPVPAMGDVTQSEKIGGKDDTKDGEIANEKQAEEEFDVKKEQQRMKTIVNKARKRRVLWRKEVTTKLHGLGRSIVAGALDIVLPGTIVGWINADPGTVGVVMFVTSVLTGLDVWERCGREVGDRS